jgi:hypothetical protein
MPMVTRTAIRTAAQGTAQKSGTTANGTTPPRTMSGRIGSTPDLVRGPGSRTNDWFRDPPLVFIVAQQSWWPHSSHGLSLSKPHRGLVPWVVEASGGKRRAIRTSVLAAACRWAICLQCTVDYVYLGPLCTARVSVGQHRGEIAHIVAKDIVAGAIEQAVVAELEMHHKVIPA